MERKTPRRQGGHAVAITQPAQLSYTIQDEIGVKAALTQYLKVDPAMTIAQFLTLFNTQAGLVDLCVSGQLIHGRAEIVAVPSGVKGAPVAGSRVEQTGLFTLGNAANSRSFGQDVPAWSNTKITSGHIPITDTDVANLFGSWITPATLSEFCSNQFLALNALRTTAITFRKRRALESKLTSEVG